jgi:hypothetical protein
MLQDIPYASAILWKISVTSARIMVLEAFKFIALHTTTSAVTIIYQDQDSNVHLLLRKKL